MEETPEFQVLKSLLEQHEQMAKLTQYLSTQVLKSLLEQHEKMAKLTQYLSTQVY